ncbi:hypothetical protein [Streptomyces sp. NPDC006997]|uniref:hypothetical protein n=1 Tax=Streptomyces sp. NPDC006997 TaxID=3155356 RepID=UPI0033FEA167
MNGLFCGERADAVPLWPLLGHPEGRVRAAAVAGSRVLDVTDARRLLPLLDDPVPSVVREAERLLDWAGRTLRWWSVGGR